ncbi:hypothetical protein MPTK1_2g23720 [Marchantia polymorpha subsp. ruderalis]|uniref:Uncharacterized protein n=1 Tax=Marchantia polymorpha TaxID=3197 RepID=A0A2R6WPC0_MARPO|nr:hypothetical protein MARPO_0069s0021 [Marchantia polymorpha]BBN03468.1 hypothetical protein Mp_2g23720 [Marchantia polymorpha subsp. ruderalis]|eukprot:PTQ35673.1 hypothetical protein MARPO_0069s0021 [Marchantia polymorpha]
MGEQDVNHAHCLDSGCLCCGIYSTNCVELHRRQKVNSRGGCASTSTAKYSCPAPPTDFAHVISNSRSNPSATSTQSPTPTPLPDPLSMHAVGEGGMEDRSLELRRHKSFLHNQNGSKKYSSTASHL